MTSLYTSPIDFCGARKNVITFTSSVNLEQNAKNNILKKSHGYNVAFYFKPPFEMILM